MELDAEVNRIDLDILMAKNPTQFGYHHGPIFPGENLAISSMNTQVCDVVVDAHGTMCGKTFGDNTRLYRHIREQHFEFGITTPGKVRARPDEKRVGRNTIQRWVLGGGWRQARYFNEPRTLHPDSLIMQYANSFELLAVLWTSETCLGPNSIAQKWRGRVRVSHHCSPPSCDASEQESSSDAQV
ncbi:uncharacterized protein BBA_01091 [Beauveria bassiana ARSEF 2860]|uniref:Uncharacterized protein n=1 Tax=Beauveria bassiana (strain ARSEF 2860) TaxID=655819 RepID=J4UVM5_BEAB2|nr:uncharacterized protein BBA_01091 [Beauveria bassiana ARSEF 2860]EJP70222.1 hypothetical protein BBA_01091 [Beauveria bassiana ARSEF 2860]